MWSLLYHVHFFPRCSYLPIFPGSKFLAASTAQFLSNDFAGRRHIQERIKLRRKEVEEGERQPAKSKPSYEAAAQMQGANGMLKEAAGFEPKKEADCTNKNGAKKAGLKHTRIRGRMQGAPRQHQLLPLHLRQPVQRSFHFESANRQRSKSLSN